MSPKSVLTYALNGTKYLASRPGPPDRDPLNMRPNGPQGLSGCFGEENDLLLLPEFERQFLGSAARSLDTIVTELTSLFCTKAFGKNVIHKTLKKKHDRLKEAS